jgi:hypothetical protein
MRSGSGTNFYYSFDVGLIHYVVIDTEVYRYESQTNNSPHPFTAQQQLNWLESDLKKANTNRDAVPWVVMMGHKGWYMNNWGEVQDPDQITTNFTAFDDLACHYGVDLYLTGHVHIYQRFMPLLGPDNLRFMAPPRDVDRTSVSSDTHTYRNPKYMPTIVVAAPGDDEISPRVVCPGLEVADRLFWKDSQVKCTAAYGYGHLQAVNSTHLYWEYVQTGKAPNVKESGVLPLSWRARMEKMIGSTEVDELFATAAEDLRVQEEKDQRQVSVKHGDLIRDYLWIVQDNHGARGYC